MLCTSACVRPLRDAETGQQPTRSTRAYLLLGGLVPGPRRADVQLCTVTPIRFCGTSRLGFDLCGAMVRAPANDRRYHRNGGRHFVRDRLVPFLLPVPHVEVHPESDRTARVRGLLDLDSFVFCRVDFPERHTVFGYICFPPMALAEVVTGAYLVLFAVGKRRAIFAVTAPSAMEI